MTDQNLPDGGFLKLYTLNFRVDTAGSVAGACDWYLFGSYYSTEERNIGSITIDETPPTLLPTHFSRFNDPPARKTLDTRQAGNSGPIFPSANEVGQWLYKFQTNGYSTNCNIPEGSPIVTKAVNVVSCEPMWWRGAVTFHQQPGPLRIYIPPAMCDQLNGPAQASADDWNTALGGIVTFTVTSVDCGSNGDCIKLTEGSVGTGCAETSPPTAWDPTTGVVSHSRTVVLPSAPDVRDWHLRSPQRLERTITHELGHVLGLNDYARNAASTCPSQDDSVMAPIADPSGTCVATPHTLSPTINDVLATKNTYNNGVVRVCGF